MGYANKPVLIIKIAHLSPSSYKHTTIRTMMYCIFLAVNVIGIQIVILNSYECFRTGHLFCVLQIFALTILLILTLVNL